MDRVGKFLQNHVSLETFPPSLIALGPSILDLTDWYGVPMNALVANAIPFSIDYCNDPVIRLNPAGGTFFLAIARPAGNSNIVS